MIKFDEAEMQRRVDEVLYYVWDPIGVSDEPYASAEYDGYVLGVLRAVQENNEMKPISDYLEKIIREEIGTFVDREKCDYAANLLLKHKEAIKERCA